jgi:hypothetical protein
MITPRPRLHNGELGAVHCTRDAQNPSASFVARVLLHVRKVLWCAFTPCRVSGSVDVQRLGMRGDALLVASGKRSYDLIDSLFKKWEWKCDGTLPSRLLPDFCLRFDLHPVAGRRHGTQKWPVAKRSWRRRPQSRRAPGSDYDVSNTLRMPAKIEIVLESLFRISMPDSHLGKLRT